MKLIINIMAVALLSVGLTAPASAAETKATSLDQLLLQVERARTADSKINRMREAKFRREKSRQKALLADAKAQKVFEDKRSVRLKKQFDENEKSIDQLTEDLRIKAGNLGEMFGVVKQVTAEESARFRNSLITTQIKGRTALLDKLGARKELPTIKELQELWVALQQEMTQQGKIVKFSTEIINTSGARETRTVTRIGAFNLLDADGYLFWDPDSQEIKALQRQPESKYVSMAEDYVAQTSGIHAVGMDPSRGSLLSKLVEKKDLWERYQDGGIVGYVITLLFAFGLVLSTIRIFGLLSVGGKVRAQMKSSTPGNNPLGRVMKIYLDNRDTDVENLELKLDEAILKETPKLEWGITIIKVLAALSPLLGLLGTVVGMIGTFQAITLFGTGDPRTMAGGISTALVTTVLGLVSAIPLIFLHSIVSGQSRSIIHILEEQSAGLIAQHAEKEG